MRVKLVLATSAAVVAAGSAVVLSTPVASAVNCPPGTVHVRDVKLPNGTTVPVCVPGQECDPRPCDPTAAPQRD